MELLGHNRVVREATSSWRALKELRREIHLPLLQAELKEKV